MGSETVSSIFFHEYSVFTVSHETHLYNCPTKKMTHQNNTDYQNLNNSSNFAQKEILS